jgi:membrane-associated HD superfamily phosphohydrolase
MRPYFFVENQMNGINVQDRLDPRTSAQIIISHVKDGLDLAKKYRLPRDVRAFIPEHQGRGLIKYFYHQALEQADDPSQVDEGDFRYPGPRPQSKETAIVMLADSCEAAVRAAHPNSVEEIDKIARRIINDKLANGDLDECDLTTRDLDQIRSAFVKILQGVFHPRIKYPEEVKEELARSSPAALPSPQSIAAGDE